MNEKYTQRTAHALVYALSLYLVEFPLRNNQQTADNVKDQLYYLFVGLFFMSIF